MTALLREAKALKAAGRLDDALALNLQAVRMEPDNGVAEHNLAATLGDLSRFAEAVEAASRAIAKGLDAPETWLVLARALQGVGRLDEADGAFRAALARRPGYVDAHRDLAQLRWMRTGEMAAATSALDDVLARSPTPELTLVKARILRCAGNDIGAAAVLAAGLASWPDMPMLSIAAAQVAATTGESETQLAHATAALRTAPHSPDAARAAIEALLHLGRAREAEQLALRLLATAPADQGVLALLATAWRLLGDPRYEELCNTDLLISSTPIDAPTGWATREAFLVALSAALRELHVWRTHPLDQSVRHGSQTQQDLTRSEAPVIQALFRALDAPIRRHIDALGEGRDPVRARRGNGYRIIGAWSVLLQPGGRHVDHVHPQGWISSAFHVELPPAIGCGHEGWLAFGRPGVPTRPILPPTHHVRPEPGHLVLFPSYFWHGTEQFGGDAPRLTVAFDILPC
ncbi:putative 2OG-Fe(II) oxygenase [Sphingomonas oleivorans]|uniref:putative 2OG-Fe(II) oxygenase n=1 Tax=Sphingomonas oleivorans TaxID=1735121 RepID=UPI0013FD5E36|nr:putative 2OG-Fe(II) oxygenase [Sphingomonas oleivorans]